MLRILRPYPPPHGSHSVHLASSRRSGRVDRGSLGGYGVDAWESIPPVPGAGRSRGAAPFFIEQIMPERQGCVARSCHLGHFSLKVTTDIHGHWARAGKFSGRGN